MKHPYLVDDLATLRELGAVIVLPSGDEIELSPKAIEDHLLSVAERQEEAANEAYYGGDGPPGCYGSDDTRR
jgi:hypothetical protein